MKRRKNMKSKIITLLLAMIAILAMLVSCGGGGDDGGDGGDGGSGNGGTTGGGSGNGGATGGDVSGDKYENFEYTYDWTATKLIAQMNMDDNVGELSSGTRQYYAGELPGASSSVDKKVAARNTLAETTTKVDVEYAYLEDDTGFSWGNSIGAIESEVNAGGSTAPDIYCNHAYDMTCAATKGLFMNLLSTDSKDYANKNYFKFVQDGYEYESDNYFDASVGEGYFYQYMRSLSLTPDTRIYCLASNYCVDLVRAFLVVPVNVDMMNTKFNDKINNTPAGDTDGDKYHTIKDFYNLVWGGEQNGGKDPGWNYDAVAKYSNAVYANTNTANSGADIGDQLGFVAGASSGLTASGFLYTTTVKILSQKSDGTYYYADTNPALVEISGALNDLFSKNTGVITLKKDDLKNAAAFVDTNGTELEAIRSRFSTGNILFGGIIMVGSLEDSVYQKMRTEGNMAGFGIVPVPLYKDYEEGVTEYQTLVHNVARICAISAATTEASQCTAFLAYQSEHSEDILNEYYEVNLVATAGGLAGEYSENMLAYIRNHVNDCFDKTYEDAIAQANLQKDSNAMSYRWHYILSQKNYQYTGLSAEYGQYKGTKQQYLNNIWADWCKLSEAK